MTNISDNIEIGKIIGKQITGNASHEELVKLEKWLDENPRNKITSESIENDRELVSTVENLDQVNHVQGWQKLEDKSLNNSLRKQMLKWKIAAIIIFLLGFSGSIIGFLNTNNKQSLPTQAIYTTVVTEKGQTSRIILPDSSVVWLNAGTKLTYNNNFSVDNRDVNLKGEAYFKVKRNESIPLIVHCAELEVKVLGTEFDVSAFDEDDNVNIVLEKGSVELSHIKNKFNNFQMKPGEIARFDDVNNKLVISTVDTYEYISWKDGVLIFNDAVMKEVIAKLELWYGVEIDVTAPEIYNLILNATIVDENLEDIFRLIKYTCDINYKIVYSHDPLIPIKITICKNN